MNDAVITRDVCSRRSQSRCLAAARRPAVRQSAGGAGGRRCGYAFSYDEHCGRLVANSMQLFASTESLADWPPSVTATALSQSAAATERTPRDAELVWCSASDVDVDLPSSRPHRLDILTE